MQELRAGKAETQSSVLQAMQPLSAACMPLPVNCWHSRHVAVSTAASPFLCPHLPGAPPLAMLGWWRQCQQLNVKDAT